MASASSSSLGEGARTGPDTIRPRDSDAHPRNIVLFGETGVGKSSIINLIAGQKLAPTSDDALGCTAEHQRYDITLPCDLSTSSPVTVTLWDTAGLDEGTQGTVPAMISTGHLKSHHHTLARGPSGVHLLLFCIRGTARVTRALARQYDLVHAGMCRKKVPIALVVTGLEHLYLEQPGVGMEHWWAMHKGEVERLGMVFDAHACVTTAEVEVEVAEGVGRRLASQIRLRQLVVECTRPGTVPWKIEPSWRSMMVSQLCRIFRAHGTSRADGERDGEVDSSNVYRFYVALRQWLAGMARVITDSDHSLLETIPR